MKKQIFLLGLVPVVFTALILILSCWFIFGKLSGTSFDVDFGTSEFYSNPYSDMQPFMEGIYAADQDVSIQPVSNTRIIVVPHHLVASKSIAAGIASLKATLFKRIILLSPDHFNACQTRFCITSNQFKTFFGTVSSSSDIVNVLASSTDVSVNIALFNREHGIYGVLPFIAYYFPDVEVTPIVLSQKLPWKDQRDQLLEILNRVVDDQTILIISSDFSHYLSLDQANIKDEQTQKVLERQDLEGVMSLENPQQSDCPGCLWLASSIAKQLTCSTPSILFHTNSATILGDESVSQTTSHYAMRWVCSE